MWIYGILLRTFSPVALQFVNYLLFHLVYSFLVTTYDTVPYYISIVVQEIEIVQMAFFLIVFTVMLQNFHESKNVKLHIRQR